MDHLEYLKSGFESAQKRFQETQQRMQKMQAEFGAVVQEFNAWQTLYQAEMAKQGAAPQAAPPAPKLPNNRSIRVSLFPRPKSDNNQTEAVRAVLRERPAGMTPNEIWKQVESQMANRTYLYSVLKRLKEKGDAVERRGKYYPKQKQEVEAITVQ